jgi:hypothetical protein
MVAGNFLPTFLMNQMKTNKLRFLPNCGTEAFRGAASALKRVLIFLQRNQKRGFTETFKYFAKWA